MAADKSAPPFDHGVFLVHLNKGREALSNKDYELARLELELALRYRPEDEDVLNLLGLIYFKLKKYHQASDTYGRLLEKNDNIFILHSNLGLVLFKQGKVDEAEDHLKRATELNPNYAKAHLYLGLVYRRLGKYGMALEHFKFAGADNYAEEMEDKLKTHLKQEEKPEPVSSQKPLTNPESPRPVHDPEADKTTMKLAGTIPKSPMEDIETTAPIHIPPMTPRATRAEDSDTVIPMTDSTRPIPRQSSSENVAKQDVEDRPFRSVGDTFLRDTEEVPEKISLPTVKTVEHIGQKFVLHKNGFLEIHTPDKVYIKKGTLNSYVGNFRFNNLDTFQGTTAQTVTVAEGAGKLFLFEKGKQTYLIDLNDEFLFVEGKHLLSLEHELSVRQELTFPTPPDRSMDVFKIYGRGAVALVTSIEPLVLRVTPEYPLTIQASSLVAWSGHMIVNAVDESESEVMLSGEAASHTLRFEGEGIIVAEQVC